MTLPALRGLYAITSRDLCARESLLLAGVESALRGGAVMVQYRDKWNGAPTRTRYARLLLAACRAHGARLIVNDDVELAAAIGADGVHLGASDMPLAQGRACLPPDALLGVSCSNSEQRIAAAASAGASYAALGRFYPSLTKPDAPQVTVQQLREARALHPRLPLCAIGGITPDNAAPLIAAGADLIAAVEGVFGASDIEAAARGYSGLF